ncbi:MAG: DUF167 domain-containing protein [Rhizobiales bacterium]|nr:DUF167 domain-containing protein [Hyphomicrobiales bacterium]
MTGRTAISRTGNTHIVLNVRVTPKSGADAINGLYQAADGAISLKLRVNQPPDKGKANKAVIALLAKRLGFAKSALSIVAGDTSRNKQIKISGQPQAIIRSLEKITGPGDEEN